MFSTQMFKSKACDAAYPAYKAEQHWQSLHHLFKEVVLASALGNEIITFVCIVFEPYVQWPSPNFVK